MQKREIIQCTLYIITAVIVLYVFGISYTSGSSMYPTIQDGSVLIMNRVIEPEHDSIVVIWSSELRKDLCKRVIGMPGDHIVISNGEVTRNGKSIEDGFEKSYKYEVDMIVGKDMVFVLGDNRNNSTDSRALGCLPMRAIKGVVVLNTGLHKTYFIISVIAIIAILYIFSIRRDNKSKRRICKNIGVKY